MSIKSFASIAGLAVTLVPGCLMAANNVATENQKTGTTAWIITTLASNHEIEGYASLTSVNRGGTITLFVNTVDPTFNVSVYRVGWYKGAGGRLVASSGTLQRKVQPACPQTPSTGMIECNWQASYTLNVPTSATDWTSGVYLAKLTAGVSGRQSYIIFVVRNDGQYSDYFFQSSVTTFQAYNGWGGRSLYGYNSTPEPARKVSFNRPYDADAGSGDFYYHWEINMLRFLEREGYDVTYCTDLDTHRDGSLILQHAGFLSVGHDEYWSWQMRNNIEAARSQGVSLGFFAANVGYWQVRFEPSAITGGADRTMVCYKQYIIAEDPYYTDPTKSYLTTTRFRDAPINRPEDALIGTMHDDYDNQFIDVDLVISDASSWVYAGTGLVNGNTLHGMIGYEADRVFTNAPPGTAVISHSPVRTAGFSDVTTYKLGNSTVFAAGSMQWPWGLDDTTYNGHGRVYPAMQQIVRNILARFVNTDASTESLVNSVDSFGSVNTTYTDYAGMQIRMANVAQTLVQLGYWCEAGDLSSHPMKMTANTSGHPDLFAPVSVPCDGQVGFHYVNAPTGITLAANTTYHILALGTPFYNSGTSVTPTAAATIIGAMSLSQELYWPETNPNRTYGPLDVRVKPVK